MSENKVKQLVLIVDDSPQNRQVLELLLEELECDIVSASDGRKALDLARDRKPDLVLMDVMMPVMDGFEACRKLQEDPSTRDIPLIFLTAMTNSDDIAKGFELGAVDYVTKPFKSIELLARVRNHLKIRKMVNELALLNQTKNKFFSIIAHDLKNPFYTIIGFSEMLMKNIDQHSREEQLRFLQLINHSGTEAHELLENLLNWSRIQIGTVRAEKVSLSSLDLVEQVVQFLKPMASQKSIKLIRTEVADIQLRGDENMIQTILRNLGSNAIKYTEPAGEVKFIVRESDDTGYVEFIVKDTGIGMSEEIQTNLFRIDAKKSRKGTGKETGTGLGLILCKEFAEYHGGSISFISKKNAGSTFTVNIPFDADFSEE